MFTDINSKMILHLGNGSMNDITLEQEYNSMKIWCMIIEKEEEKCNDDKYECEE